MAAHEVVPWLIAYDIRDPRRLRRLHRFLRKRAVSVQYSVFVAWKSPAQMGRLVQDIEKLLDTREDDVRVYRLPDPVEATWLGRSMLSDVISLSSGGSARSTIAGGVLML